MLLTKRETKCKNRPYNKNQVKCEIPQISILALHLFLLYVNGLKNALNLLDPIMFVHDSNLFCTQRNIHSLILSQQETDWYKLMVNHKF